jgi:acyl-CoA thioester hydrolase
VVSARPERLTRDTFRVFWAITTRWADNDVFGHVNNVVYYAWFDTAVNGWLIEQGLLHPTDSPLIGLVVRTECDYAESIAFPDRIEIGLAVARIGTSSVTYGLGVFREGAPLAAAQGLFSHVYVDRISRRPVPLPPDMRQALMGISA